MNGKNLSVKQQSNARSSPKWQNDSSVLLNFKKIYIVVDVCCMWNQKPLLIIHENPISEYLDGKNFSGEH